MVDPLSYFLPRDIHTYTQIHTRTYTHIHADTQAHIHTYTKTNQLTRHRTHRAISRSSQCSIFISGVLVTLQSLLFHFLNLIFFFLSFFSKLKLLFFSFCDGSSDRSFMVDPLSYFLPRDIHTDTHAHIHTHEHTHTQTHPPTHPPTRTHTHTHTHTYIQKKTAQKIFF